MMNNANVCTVQLEDGREVCLSYGVIVAAFIPRGYVHKGVSMREGGYFRTKERYSVTTSRHMNSYAGKDAPEIPDVELRALVAPVTDKRS